MEMDLSSNVTVNNSKLGLKIVRKVKERGMKYGEKANNAPYR